MGLFPHVRWAKISKKIRDLNGSVDGWYDPEKYQISVVWNVEDDDRLKVLCALLHELDHHILNLLTMTHRPKMRKLGIISMRVHDFWDFIQNPPGFIYYLLIRPIECGDFEFTTRDGVRLKNIFEVLNEPADVATIEVSGQGLRTQIMDPSQAAMICLKIPKKSFNKYHLEGYAKIGGYTEMTVDLRDLVKGLKKAGKDEKVVLSRLDGELKLTIWGRHKTILNINECEEEAETVQEPDLQFDGRIKLVADTLYDALEKLETKTGMVKLVIKDQGLTIKKDTGEKQGEIEFSRGDKMVLSCEGGAEANYDITWLLDVIGRLKKICRELVLEFSTDTPLRIWTKTPNHELLDFYLAPIVTTD